MDWSYLFKHWFGTLIMAPIIAQIIDLLMNKNNQILNFYESFPLFILFGLFFSTPTYLLYSILFYYLKYKNIKNVYAKIILISFALLGIIITFWLISGTLIYNGILIYCISSIITGTIFKIKTEK
jgi:hypothetical protein